MVACSYDWTVHRDAGADAGPDTTNGDAGPTETDEELDSGSAGPEDAGVDSSAYDAASEMDAYVDARCPSGYTGVPGDCHDVDECSEGTSICHATAACKNTDGNYDCTCKAGYSGGGSRGIACSPRIAVGGTSSGTHFCAVRPAGDVVCWGKNASGQLGDGTTSDRALPTPVSGLVGAAMVVAGADSSCALMEDGTVKCWGASAGKVWGDGSLVPVALGGLADIVQLSLGTTGCALDVQGAVYCWGDNSDGQVGNGQSSGIPVTRPVKVNGLQEAAWLSSHGQTTSCSAMRNGAAYCWGKGLLTSSETTSSTVPIAFPGLTDAVEVLPLYARTCARHYDKNVTCWGNPTLIANTSSGPAWVALDVVSIAGGLYQTCVVATKTGLSCWNASTNPSQVIEGSDVIVVAASFGGTYGLTATGNLKYWNMGSATPVRDAAKDVQIW